MVIDSKTVGSKLADLKNHKAVTAAVIVALILSFYGGMQYQSYRIKKAITDTFGQLGAAFGEGLTGSSSASSAKATETKPKDNPLNTKVVVELQSKEFVPDDFFSQIKFKLNITNKSDKAMKGIQGKLHFKDVFDNEMKVVSVSYDKAIGVGESKVWEGAISYNSYLEEDVKLKETDVANLKYVWDTETIVYEDGSKETN